jgi:hypothetical protein
MSLYTPLRYFINSMDRYFITSTERYFITSTERYFITSTDRYFITSTDPSVYRLSPPLDRAHILRINDAFPVLSTSSQSLPLAASLHDQRRLPCAVHVFTAATSGGPFPASTTQSALTIHAVRASPDAMSSHFEPLPVSPS